MPRRICLALDLVDDADLIAEYERWHQVGNTPPEILASIHDAGIENMEIFRLADRMVMVMDVTEDFDAAAKAKADEENPHVVAWEKRMQQFQRALPGAPRIAWTEMERIFRLIDHPGS